MVEILGRGGQSDRASIPLGTRQGNHIRNERRMERAPAQQRASIELWRRERPEAKLRSITAIYNCMGLIFASRRTHIDIDHLRMIFTEDGYRQSFEVYEVQVGDIVVYARNRHEYQHVGIVSSIELDIPNGFRDITVMSKWGSDGEYLHPIDHVPEMYGTPVEFWTNRRIIL